MTEATAIMLHALLASVSADPSETPTPDGTDGPTTSESAERTPEQLDEEARRAYADRDYAGAARAFEQAHELTDDPNYLFNIGRVYEEGGELDKAVDYYERFVEQPEVTLEARRGALERLDVLRKVLAVRERAREDDEPPPPTATAVSPPTEGLRPTDAMADDADDTLRRKRLQTAGIVLASVGGAGVVVGAVLGGLAQNQANILESEQVALEDRRRRIDAANTYAAAADGLFIGGGVLAATGVALIIASVAGKKKRNRETSRLRWSPVAGPSFAAIDLRMHF